jgi:hypothetical protein
VSTFEHTSLVLILGSFSNFHISLVEFLIPTHVDTRYRPIYLPVQHWYLLKNRHKIKGEQSKKKGLNFKT